MNYFKLSFYVVFAVSILLNIFLLKGCKKDKQIAQSNSNQISKDSSREVVYSVEEIQTFLAAHDSATLSNIKPKFITKYVCARLSFSDSVKIANSIRPVQDEEIVSQTIPEDDVRFINVQKECYNVNVISYKDSSIVQTDFNSDLSLILFQKYKYSTFLKRCLHWFDFSKINDSAMMLNCAGDSIPIKSNFIIQK